MLRLFKNSRHAKVFDDIALAKSLADKEKISISQSFQKYIEEILPKYEIQIETSILRTLHGNLKSPLLKKHLINVYKRRQLHLVYKAFKPDLTVLPIQPAQPAPPAPVDYLGKDITKARVSDIGKMYEFPLEEFLRYFPRVNFGHLDFVDRVMRSTRSFAFLMSPEAFTVIELLRKKKFLSGLSFESFDMPRLFRHANSKQDLEVLFSDHEVFYKLLLAIGENLRDALRPLRFHPKFEQLFGNSFLTDYIALILVWHLDRPDIRSIILNSDLRRAAIGRVVDEIVGHEHSKYFLPHKIESWLENQKVMTLSEGIAIDLTGLKGYHKKVPDALRHYWFQNFVGLGSNLLVWGPGGAGKSGLLYAVTMWAIKSKWLVIKLPSVKALTFSNIENLLRHEKSRLWMAPVMAEAILEDFAKTNQEILRSIPVNQDIYGNYNVVGVHKDEPNPVPNFYIEDRQTYFYEAEKFRHEEELNYRIREQEYLDVPLRDKLPSPSTLADIADFGLKNPDYCTNCIAEILEQAYHLKSHSVLVAVDDYNWFFHPTNNPAFYYENIKTLEGYVPPYHVALARLFIRFDGHMISNGFKLAGTSNFSIERHLFLPRKINFPEEFCKELDPIRVQDVENFLAHFYTHGLDSQTTRDWDYYKTLWMETQGNYGRMVRLVSRPDFRGLDG